MINKAVIKEAINTQSIFVGENGINVNDDRIKENYIEVVIGDTLKVYEENVRDVREKNPVTRTIKIPPEGLLLEPNRIYLGRTVEYTKTKGFVPMLSGTQEVAATGTGIHITAGFGDNGFEGTWTLEIVAESLVRIFSNIVVGKLFYNSLIGDQSFEYGGKYQGQIDPTASRMGDETLTSTNNIKDIVIKKSAPSIPNSGNGVILTNNEIKRQMDLKNIQISNLEEDALNKPNSCKVGIGDTLYTLPYSIVDIKDGAKIINEIKTGDLNLLKKIKIPQDGILLEPHKMYLAPINQKIKTKGYIPVLHGRTNFSLYGLSIELNSGYYNDDYDDYPILSIVSTKPLLLPPNVDVGNLTFFRSLDQNSNTAGMLSGMEIIRRMETGDIVISPSENIVINPNSVNLTLSPLLGKYDYPIIDLTAKDLRKANPVTYIEIPKSGYYLSPNNVYLAETNEWTETYNLVPMMSGRSSIGRNGLYVHCSAGMGSIGYNGHWHMGVRTVEEAIIIPKMKCCQVYYYTVNGEITNTYNGSMQNLEGIGKMKPFSLTRKL